MRCTSHVAGWISALVIQACAPGRWTQSPAANHMQEYWRSCTLKYLALLSCLMIPCILAHCMVVWGISHLPVSLPQLHRESLTFCYTFFFSFFSHFSCPFSWEEVKIAKLFALVCLSSIHFIFVLLLVTCAIFFLPGFSLRLKLSFITVARKSEIRTNWLLIFFI